MNNLKKRGLISFLILGFIFNLTFINSVGLEILNQTSYEINVTYQQTESLVFYLKNTESFPFYNITFEDNDNLFMPTINVLEAKQVAEIHATIYGNDEINEDIKIEGFYISELGQTNETYEIDVDFIDGLSKCDFSIIEGDKIQWTNYVLDDIKISGPYTLFGGNDIIPKNESRIETFNNEGEFQYSFSRQGLKFTDICKITILSDTGQITNPFYNTQLHLKTTIQYEPTHLDIILQKNNYTIGVGKSQDGILIIENDGSDEAKNILLEGKWFSFSPNNFNLDSGYTKIVSYSINPYITTTSETNKTHNITVSISGNFETITKDFKIYVEYGEIGDSSSPSKSLIDVIKEYCEQNPNDDLCSGGTRYIYQNPNQTEVNVSIIKEDFENYQKYMILQMDGLDIETDYLKSELSSLSDKVFNTNSSDFKILNKLEELAKENNTMKEVLIFIIIFASTMTIAFLLVYVIFFVIKKRNFEKHIQWKKLKTM